jgi:hypothetical protein
VGKGKRRSGEETVKAEQQATRTAARQWGVLTWAQAIKAGLTPDQIAYRLKTGRWRKVAHGVYVVAGAPSRWEQTAMIACLAGPSGTVVSHLTAAACFGLAKPPAIPQVTVTLAASGRFRGADIRRASLGPGERCIRWKLPCTSPTRTVIDCAGLLDDEALCDMVDSALCKKLMQPSRLIKASGRALAAARGTQQRTALDRLERALDVWRSGAPAGSPPEARLQRRLAQWGFPAAERQIEVRDHQGKLVARADVGIREWRVLFEYDSDEHHGPRCWIADDERQDRIEALDHILVPIDRFDLRPSSTRLRDLLERIARERSDPSAAA